MSKNYTVMELEAIKKLCKSVNLIANLPTDLIADTNVATNTTYSSYRIDAEMSALETDIQAYVDTALAGLNKLTKEVIDDKALVVKENVLYLYKDPADINNDYMQMMLINGVAIELGSTTCDFNSVYSKDEIDAKFALKLDLDVLTTSFNNLVTSVEKKIDKDKIVTTLDDTVTDEQVASARIVVDELDLKANDSEVVKKTDIATTLDNTATDEQVASALLTKTELDKTNAKLGEKASKEEIKNFKNVHTSPKTLGITIVNGQDNTRKAFDALGVGERYQDFWTNSPSYLRWGIPAFYGDTVQIEIVKISSNYGVCTATTDKGITLQRYIDTSMTKMLGWQRLCNTTVADVPRTVIVSENTNVILNSKCVYTVVNGVCYVSLWGFQCASAGHHVVNSSMPKTRLTMEGSCTYDTNGFAGGCAYILYDGNGNNTLYVKALATQPLYGTFSYPVAE